MTETILPIVLIVLVLMGIWAVVEIALTMRTARREVEQVSASAREVVEQAQPVVAKLDGIMDELEPAAKRVTPLLEKTEAAVGEATGSLDRLNAILDDVSSVSGAAAGVTGAVKGVAESAAAGVAGVVSRLKGGPQGDAPRLDGKGPEKDAAAERPAHEERPQERVRYVDYAEVAASEAPDSAADPDVASKSETHTDEGDN